MAAKSPEAMMAAVTDSMKARTGKTLEDWVKTVASSGIDPLDQKAVRNWLKTEHKVPQNSQWAIADAAATAAGWVRPSNEAYTDSQYAGDKAALRPIFNALRQFAEACGPDVSMEGRGGYTPFVRKRQFMAVEASSKSKVTLGLRYKAAPASARLEEGRAPGQCTHRVFLSAPEQVDSQIASLIQAAYDQN